MVSGHPWRNDRDAYVIAVVSCALFILCNVRIALAETPLPCKATRTNDDLVKAIAFVETQTPIFNLCLTNNGRVLHTLDADNHYRRWEVTLGTLKESLRRDGIRALASRSEHTVILCTLSHIEMWQSDPMEKKDSFPVTDSLYVDRVITASGANRHVARPGSGNTIEVWTLSHPRMRRVLSDDALFTFAVFPIGAIAISPNGKLLAANTSEGDAVIWDIERGQVAQLLPSAYGDVCDVAFSADSEFVATAHPTQRRTIIWSCKTGRKIRSLIQTASATKIVYGSDDVVFIGYVDGTVSAWRTDGNEEKTLYTGEGIGVTAITFNSGRRLLTWADGAGGVRLYKIEAE